MAREVRQPGVELHGKSFRFRMRVMEEVAPGPGTQGKAAKNSAPKVMRAVSYQRWPFVEGREAASLDPDHPLRRANALAQANKFAIEYRHRRKSPMRLGGIEDAKGTLLEWLLRYQVEALDLRHFDPREVPRLVAEIEQKLARGKKHPGADEPEPVSALFPPLKFDIQPRASAKHDKGQIRTIVSMALREPDIAEMLRTQVRGLSSQQFQRLLALWSGGKAAAATKRRLISTFSCVWNHHAEFHNMPLAKPWDTIKIHGTGEKPKPRALTKTELAKADQEFGRLHPTVRGVIEFLRWTGARRGEAAKLTWDKLYWPTDEDAAPSAHFERTKAARGTYKARFTYLEDDCIVALARMVASTDPAAHPKAAKDAYWKKFDWRKFPWPTSGWVFPMPRDPSRHIPGQTIYQAFVRSVRHAGVDHASPHFLRHTKATVLTATVPQAMAQELLGHDDASTFAIYRHLAEEAGYMVRDKGGHLVNAETLRTRNDVLAAFNKLPKAEQGKILLSIMGASK